MARRKRIPYDPPGQRKKKRRGGGIPRRADQIFMTRRMFLAKGIVVSAFAALATRLGWMQLAQGQEYKAQAENNTIRDRPLKAPRGMIFDRAGRELATNRRAWQVRLIPGQLPDDPGERQMVFDTLINALDLPDALVVDRDRVPKGEESTVFGRLGTLLDNDPEFWIDRLTRLVEQNYLVLVDSRLTADEAARFRAMAPHLPGVSVMNILEYLVGNAGDFRAKIVVKTDVPEDIALKLEANKLYLPGIELDDSVLVRRYPGGPSMSHILGYVQPINDEEYRRDLTDRNVNPVYQLDDFIGREGIEVQLEETLRGAKGVRWVEVDSNEIEQRVLEDKGREAKPGDNITLTIDLELQALAADALGRAVAFSNADRQATGKIKKEEQLSGSGAVVAIDPRTGEVLAMVSFPHYDNQLFVDGISDRKYKSYIADKKQFNPLLDRTTRGRFPPGSTLKLFLAAAALQDKKITTEDTFTCTGAIRVPLDTDESKGNNYPCWLKDPGHGALDVYGGIEHSCDVFFYNVGAPRDKAEGARDYLHYFNYNPVTRQIIDTKANYFKGLGIDQIHDDLYDQFWFGTKTGVELPMEDEGLVPTSDWLYDATDGKDFWSLGDTINVSIGQGYFLCTPLQLATNVAALANGGKILKPTIVREVADAARKKVEPTKPITLRQARIDQEHLETVREGMRRVVHSETGTAAVSFINGVRVSKWQNTNPEGEDEILIAGKTGTAEFGSQDPETLEYENQHAWFAAFAPLDDPEIAIAVLIENGGQGSTYAVPVADQVLRGYFELTGKRARKLLREDKTPIVPGEGPADTAGEVVVTPEPGTIANDAEE
ncbi:MAG: Peptidoglycan D,D-transpeptidase MrdA [uncultured Thermomicrobiales bacterium]|uniref:Peptidoglycan D,D-transpeptidase MrdA n=1 Tax=uncultured Thermomicrobiales bacterium TaxID=1645740 RepID=A0A6J4UEK2_9BACT|nr:MAG: Peptidoglycan D,D-transpeptidase MrdA [uncultured Thermomicrobiales bacterium]